MAGQKVRTRKVLLRRKALLQEFISIVLAALAALAGVGLDIDPMFSIGIALSAYACWHLIQAARLLLFLLRGARPPVRWVWGIWREAFDQLRRLKQRENKRKRRHRNVFARIRKMAEVMPDAVLTLGMDGEVSWLNRQAELYFGLRDESVMGRRLVDLIEDPTLREYLHAGQFRRGLEVEAPGDPALMLAISVTRFKKRRERYLLVARDITRQYHLNRTQRDFTLNVSHELRTPLTVLRGYLETLLDSGSSRSPQWLPLQRMHEQVDRMQGVIQDLFTLSRLEYGAESLNRDAVVIYELVTDVMREVSGLAANTHHELELQGDPGLRVLGDESLLRCAILNLVANAVRHTPSRTRVEINWARMEEGGARLEVRDNGEGIPARHIPRLTERFYRVDASRSREAGGTGLGLAIVRQILDLHEAQLSIRSEPGRGSNFACVFPAQLVCASDAASPAQRA